MNTSDEEKRPREKGARGGLFRRFVLPQIIITGVAGMLALFAAGKAQRALDRERLEDVVASIIPYLSSLWAPGVQVIGNHWNDRGFIWRTEGVDFCD